MKNDYVAIWNELEKQAQREQKPHALVRRIIPQSQLDAFIGIEFPDSRRIFALEVTLESLNSLDDFPVFKGLEIAKKPAVTDDKEKAALFVILKAARFTDVFSVFVEDIAKELSTVEKENEALAIIISRLVEWQQFTEEEDSVGLSSEARRGLYGELYFLATHLIPQFGSRAVLYWKGFAASQQDFYLGKSAIEVKTTITKQHQKLTIASERQLDESFFDRLFLYHVSLDELPGNTNTLPEVIQHIRDSIKEEPEPREYFEDAMFQIGYLDSHQKMYESIGYELREENLFIVEGNFPRILEKDLKPGIGDVSYSINVAECKHYSAELSTLGTLEQEVDNG